MAKRRSISEARRRQRDLHEPEPGDGGGEFGATAIEGGEYGAGGGGGGGVAWGSGVKRGNFKFGAGRSPPPMSVGEMPEGRVPKDLMVIREFYETHIKVRDARIMELERDCELLRAEIEVLHRIHRADIAERNERWLRGVEGQVK